MDFPGAIDVGGQLLVELAVAAGRSLAHHGFRRLVLVNGHATNSAPLDIAAKRLTLETASICALVDWFKLASGVVKKVRESSFPGGISHACELETSVMLHLRPDLVDMSKAEPEIWCSGSDYLWRDLYPPSPVNFMDAWSRISARGVMGDPTRATAEKGREIFEEVVCELARFVEQFRRYPVRPRADHH
jgi:creatinine amidohydrolase